MQYDALEGTIGNDEVTWEKVRKQNYGIDLKMFDSRFSLTADYFFEHRYDILSSRNTLPSIVAVNLPLMNLGIVDNKGYEISLGWNDSKRNLNWWIQGNISYSKNKIIYMDEVSPNYPWMAQTGRSTGLNYGYLFDRFLAVDDFDAEGNLKVDAKGNSLLPAMSLANPKPGDGLVQRFERRRQDQRRRQDLFRIQRSTGLRFRPAGRHRWKGFEISMQWTAGLHASRVLSGRVS